jgi:hypothetical protein
VTAETASARALLSRIHYILEQRGVADLDLEKGQRLHVGSHPVAHVHGRVVVVHPVKDGVDPRIKVLKGYERQPTGEPEQAATIAMDIMVRLTAWDIEERRGLEARHAA